MNAEPESIDLKRSFAQRVLYTVVKTVVHLGFLIFYRVRVLHAHRVPASGPLLLVGNHESFLDPMVVAVVIHCRHIHFLARATLFRNRFFAWYIRSLNASPVEEGGKSDAKAIRKAIAILQSGEALLMFPEASRSFDGQMQPFKRGAAVLIKRAKCPVVPVGISGSFEIWPRTRSLPRVLLAPQMKVAFGEPISPDELFKDGADEALDRLRREIEGLVSELKSPTEQLG